MGQSKRGLGIFWSLALVAPIAVASASACSSNEHEEKPREAVGRQSEALGEDSGVPMASLVDIADTYLKSGTPNKNQGTESTLSIKESGNHRVILKFDSAAMNGLTTGTATLELTIATNGDNWGTTGRQIAVHRLTHDWTELGATWSCAIDSNTSNSNDDCSGATAWEMGQPQHPEVHPWMATPTAVATITNGQSGKVTFDVTADVALFRSGAAPNYGFIIKKVSEGAAGAVEFSSRETSSPPRLIGPCLDLNADGVCDLADAGVDASVDASSDADSSVSCTPASCNDGIACTIDTCTITGCTHTPAPNGTVCGGTFCTGLSLCASGACVSGTSPPLDDGNSCTLDLCDDILGVTHPPKAAGTPCDNSSVCDGHEQCDGAGTCQPGTPPVVSDSNPCTDDACDPVNGVTHTPRPAGDPACSNGNPCDGLETCTSTGTCNAGLPPSLDDQNICTVDSCSPSTGVTHTPIPNCDPTPVQGSAPFETRASLMGKLVASGGGAVAGASFTVTDAPLAGMPPNAPRGDVSASTASDGSFRIRLTSFPDVEADGTPPVHVVVRIAASGFLTAYRDAWLHTGNAFDFGVIKLLARDSAVTNIGPAGGTASDSNGTIQVVIPAGALAAATPIVITPINARDDFPAPLPNSTATMYGFELEPTGTTFASPATVRIANTRGAPTNIPIPTGFFDTDRGRWEHVGQATWDGSRFVFQTTHFTTFDSNLALPDRRQPRRDDRKKPDGDCGDGNANTGSSCGLSGGAFDQSFALPSYRVKNEDFGVHLTYKSGLAGARRLGVAPSDYGAVAHSGFAVATPTTGFEMLSVPSATSFATTPVQPGRCVAQASTTFGASPPIPLTLTRSVGGSTSTETFSMGLANAEVEFGSFLDLATLSSTTSPSSGLYRTHMVLRAQSNGACVGPSGTFGVTDYAQPGTDTALEDGPLATIDTFTFVNHRLTSPFGAGWAVGDVSRAYRDGDLAYVVSGSGYAEQFRPRAHAKTMAPAAENGVALARDPRTGEIFGARDLGSIDRIDPVTGSATSVLTGLGFNVPVHGLAIAYVGASREFVVALTDRLLEIDSGGGQRVLTSRASPGPFAQANVAAKDDVVFYTDVVSPVLYRIRLSDPARGVESMSLASGGDVRFFPQATLSGMSFTDPRGLTFAPDGTLYVADRGRNTVYAVHPDGAGNVVSASILEPVVGDGEGRSLASVGERQPGVRLPLAEPLGLSMTEDGLLFVTTTYGLASFDPLAREGEQLVVWGAADELIINPAAIRVGLLGLTASSALSRWDQHHGDMVRLDIDRMSSRFEPTRTIKKLLGGQLELTDTTAETVETFDAAGRLIDRKKRTGETVMTVAYVDATSDAIDRITDAAGGETVFTYANGKIASITDARGRTTQLSVNALGDLVSFTEPGSETHTFGYAEHRMTEKRSPRGDLTQYSYRADGTALAAVRPEGATTTIDAALSHPATFNASGKVERQGTYTDARGVLHTVVVNDKGGIERDTHIEDGVTRVDTVAYAGDVFATELQDIARFNGAAPGFEYDLASDRKNRLMRVAQRAVNGVQIGTTQRFDAHGRLVVDRRPDVSGAGDTYRAQFDADGYLLETYRGRSAVGEHYDRDAAKHVTRIFDFLIGPVPSPTGRERTWTYRADGLPATMTEHGVTRTYAYEELPGALNELGWTDTLGRSMTFGRDTRGNITSTNDGATTTYATYDAKNRVIETHDALNNSTTYGYSHAGCGCSQDDLVTSIHTPDLAAGTSWEMTYDGDARLASVKDPQDFTESYQYEPTGERKKVTDKLTRETSWTHDQLGRIVTMVDALGRSHANAYAVPLSGAWTGPTLMAGGADATAPTVSLTGTLRNGDYQIGHNAYQPAGAPPQISLYRDPTFELAFTHYFDSGDRLAARNDRIGLSISDTSIPAGFERGTSWAQNLTYEALTNRALTHTLGSSGVGATMNHDFELDLTSTSGFLGDTAEMRETFVRDAGGRPTQLTRTYLGAVAVVSTSTYTYRPDGRVSQIVNADGTHDFTYDARGFMLTQVVSGEGTYTYGYDVMGRPSSLLYPDGHTRTQVYDDLGRITSRCYEYSGPTERCYTAQYDAVGNPTRLTDPDGADRFEYDALDRLKKVTREVGGVDVAVETYDYNALGALKVNAGVALDHQRPRLDGNGLADAAVPATLGGQPVSLDAGGRVTSLRGVTFDYNKLGVLRGVQEPIPAVAESYGVDGNMRRVSKTQGSTKEYYVYEGLDRVATFDESGARVESYLFDGIDHPLRINVPNGGNPVYYYYELDLAGNVRGLRASGGASLGGYRYSAFGQTLEDTSNITQPLRWKGRWFSPVAGGTYDVRARQWSPELGIFLSIDEFRWHSPTTTLWGWPGMNPIRFDDLFGRGGGAPGPAPAPGNGGTCSQPPKPCDKGPVACHFKCDSDYLKAFRKCQGRGDSSTPQSVPYTPPPQKTRAECEAEAEEAQDQCNEKCKTDCGE